MKLYGVYHFGKLYHRGIYYEWKQSSLDGINVIHIPVVLGYINIVKFMASYEDNLNPARKDGRTFCTFGSTVSNVMLS